MQRMHTQLPGHIRSTAVGGYHVDALIHDDGGVSLSLSLSLSRSFSHRHTRSLSHHVGALRHDDGKLVVE